MRDLKAALPFKRRLTAISLALVATTGLAACSAQLADQGIAPSVSPTQTSQPNTYPQCSPQSSYSNCIYGVNNALVFTGPNQLGPSVFTLASSDSNHASGIVSDWPKTWTGAGAGLPTSCPRSANSEWCAEFVNGSQSASAAYQPPAPFPASDQVELTSNHVVEASGNSATCAGVGGKPLNYSICTPVWVEQGWDSNTVFQLNNLPLIIQIQNSLPGSNSAVTLDGPDCATPPKNLGNCLDYTNMIVDTNGGWPSTVASQSSGFFGAYLPVSLAGMDPPTNPTIGMNYDVPATGTGPEKGGGQFNISLTFSNAGLDLKNSSCNFSNNTTNPPPTCHLFSIGTPGGPQRVVIQFYIANI